MNLQNVIDMHIHSAPDTRQRKMDDLELMESAVERRMRAVVIKCHCAPTAGRAALVNKVRREKYPDSNFEMFGGIVCNYDVGGLNPKAVESMFRMGGKVVWLPTFDSAYSVQRSGKQGGIHCIENDQPVKQLMDIMDLVMQYNGVLATGHIGVSETFALAKAAKKMGLKKLVVTHPESCLVGFTLQDQEQLVSEYGVYLEHCFSQPIGGGIYQKNCEFNTEAIKQIGAEHTIIATDSGQAQNAYPYESMLEMLNYLAQHGISNDDIVQATQTNPQFLLDIN